MQENELVEIKLYDGAVAAVPVGTLVAKVYYDGKWHNFRCFTPREGGYDRSADAERYKSELRFIGCGLPIEIDIIEPEPIDMSSEL